MAEPAIRSTNHYVPRLYLKRWASTGALVWAYRILVRHSKIPLWKERPISAVAYREHLYTRIAAGRLTDDVERWLDREFETPAEDSIQKAISGARLTSEDWRRLVRFLAAQDVRTPARLAEHLERWSETLPRLITETLQDSVRRLELSEEKNEAIAPTTNLDSDYFPFRVTIQENPEGDGGIVKGETIAGRGMWLFSIRHVLTRTIRTLYQHRWTILVSPDELTWFTSDDPVVRLNLYAPGKYDFKGGWGNPGTDIFLPLGPRHLLFTNVGKRPPPRGAVLSRPKAEMIRRFIAEHAHRTIYSDAPDPDVPTLRPRTIDADAVKQEAEQWKRWHLEQTTAERELMGWEEQ